MMKSKLIAGSIIGILLFGMLSTMGCILEDEKEVDMWDSFPCCGFQPEWINKTSNNDYVLSMKMVTKAYKWYFLIENLSFALYDQDNKDITNGCHKVSGIYEKPIDDVKYVSLSDLDDDGYLSEGDQFIIKSLEHVDIDGKSSPGLAEPGFYIELRCGPDGKDGRIIFRDTIPER